MRIQICAVLTIATLLAAPAAMANGQGYAAAEPSVGMKIVDIALVRWPCVLLSIVSTGVWIGTLPLTAPINVAGDAEIYMVHAPWHFTFGRYYGNFSKYLDNRTIDGRAITTR